MAIMERASKLSNKHVDVIFISKYIVKMQSGPDFMKQA